MRTSLYLSRNIHHSGLLFKSWMQIILFFSLLPLDLKQRCVVNICYCLNSSPGSLKATRQQPHNSGIAPRICGFWLLRYLQHTTGVVRAHLQLLLFSENFRYLSTCSLRKVNLKLIMISVGHQLVSIIIIAIATEVGKLNNQTIIFAVL